MQGLIKRTRDPKKRAELEAELNGPALPPALDYLWVVFRRLSNRRGSSGFGPAPISWVDIATFSQLTGVRLVPWEIECLEMLDVLHLNEKARRQ